MTSDGWVALLLGLLTLIQASWFAWLGFARPKVVAEWRPAVYGSEQAGQVWTTKLYVYNDGRAPAFDVKVRVDNHRLPEGLQDDGDLIGWTGRLDAAKDPFEVSVPTSFWYWKHDNRAGQLAYTPGDFSTFPERITATVSYSRKRGGKRYSKKWPSADKYD